MNNEMNPAQKIRVMPLGDSITRGNGGSSWRHHLRNLKAFIFNMWGHHPMPRISVSHGAIITFLK